MPSFVPKPKHGIRLDLCYEMERIRVLISSYHAHQLPNKNELQASLSELPIPH